MSGFTIYNEKQQRWKTEYKAFLTKKLSETDDVALIKKETRRALGRENKKLEPKAKAFLVHLNIRSIFTQSGLKKEQRLFLLYSYLGMREKLRNLIAGYKGDLSNLYASQAEGKNAAFFAGQEGGQECLQVLYDNYLVGAHGFVDRYDYFFQEDRGARTGFSRGLRNGYGDLVPWYLDHFRGNFLNTKANHNANTMTKMVMRKRCL